jgi:uncharacterized membrane protein YphA (DoxX/SURF4 family)
MKIILAIFRYCTGALFIFSGLIKVNDPIGTAIKLEEYFEVFAADFAPFFYHFIPFSLGLGVFLIVLEIALGVALLVKWKMPLTSWVMLSMIVFFTFLTFYSAYFNKVTDCGCFGDAIKLTPWESFTKDVVLLVMIGVIFAYRNTFSGNIKIGNWSVAMSVVISSWLAWHAIAHLPFIDFRAYKAGTSIPKAMQPSEPLRYKYIMEKAGEIFEFEKYPSEAGYAFKDMVLINPEAQPKITDYTIWNDEDDFTQESFEGVKLMVIFHDVKKASLKNMDEINRLVSEMDSYGQAVVVTSSAGDVYEAFRHEVQLAVPYYFADATLLKTIMRSNPGIMLLQEGVVKGKWHYNDVPDIKEIKSLLK